MNGKTLSKRLELVASYLNEKGVFADIGSDHAYLPCYVCLRDPKIAAIAGELNEGPYQSARSTVQELGLETRVEVRKGNGLEVIHPNEVDQVVIAGMGGALIADILEQGKDKLGKVERIITQPNVDADALRRWFYYNNFVLIDEQIIEESGHIYEVLVADAGKKPTPYSKYNLQAELLFGPFLMKQKSAPFIKKWKIEKQKRVHALEQMEKAKVPNQAKMNQFQSEIKTIEEVIGND
ncbi:tRNA (adenine(22)-N(1))-methyltransferase [Aquibacillus sediminis]|uniref:tRNA (adenine(22)-N(1))-methyltransferase n=1 Tax=Aquibacillus sediminis TaxID=2574734 RepID=UPI001FE3BFAB|nr:tRNA (adenine(22)-N(1))-methyltransferase TrmK [Aquibacillus sediminis]